jgi:hypothetical protein
MDKDIRNTNSKGKFHGCQEWYNSSGELAYRGNYKNNIDIGYQEYHLKSIKQTHFHIR